MSDAQALWTACARILRDQMTDPAWHGAFEGVEAVAFDGQTLTLRVPSPMARDRIERRYRDLVRDVLKEIGTSDVELRLEVNEAEAPAPWYVDRATLLETNGGVAGNPAAASVTNGAGRSAAVGGRPTTPDGSGTATNGATSTGSDEFSDDHPQLNPNYTFENFISGGSNQFAHAAAQAAAEMPGRKFNPLFIYGDAGLGKTHLLQAIASYVGVNYANHRVRYVTSEKFLNEFIDSMGAASRDAFKRRYRDIDVLLVDDVQFFEGKHETVEEFFHTFNHLHQSSRQIVLSSDRPPDQIGIEDRLRSRFKQGLMTDIQPPELETRLAILRKKAELEATPIPAEVLEYIATHITDNIRVLEGALIRVSAFTNLTHEPLTVEAVAKVLGDMMSHNQPRPITPQLVLEETAALFGFTIEEIVSKHRQRPLVQARQISMYVMRELTQLSYPNIARIFGGRDHTTVIHACEKIGTSMQKDRQIYDQVTLLTQRVRQGG